jgi:hypothetical protein
MFQPAKGGDMRPDRVDRMIQNRRYGRIGDRVVAMLVFSCNK